MASFGKGILAYYNIMLNIYKNFEGVERGGYTKWNLVIFLSPINKISKLDKKVM